MTHAVIVGAGPAGLSAAYEMVRHGASVAVLERLDRVGGLSRTVEHDGCRFDIGPHRFFTKNEEVNRLFQDVLGDDAIAVKRMTRIYYNNLFFDYPLSPLNALSGVGAVEAAATFGSYAVSTLRRLLVRREPENFEDWVTDHFGSRLFQMFFKTYTEKVWGIPCTQIGADWASQRIKGLDLYAAVKKAFFPSGGRDIKTLVDQFLYPRLGAGQTYDKMTAAVRARGGTVETGARVEAMRRDGFTVKRLTAIGPEGGARDYEADHFLSSAPLTEIVLAMDPPAPEPILAACRALRYREHIGVDLVLRGEPFPDNWIYVHSNDVAMARVANYRNFSAAMASPPGVSPVTVEYFCFKGDAVSALGDAELVEKAGCEIETMRIARQSAVQSGFVVRSDKAYPVIEIGSADKVRVIKEWLDQFTNLTPIGRSGMFKYNNQDHAMMTGLLAARTTLGLGRYDPWLVNIDAEYLEAGASNAPAA